MQIVQTRTRSVAKIASLALMLVAIGCGSDPGAACGLANRVCCFGDACLDGLTCVSGHCTCPDGACGGDLGLSSDGSGGAVTGTETQTFVTETGAQTRPRDFTKTVINALVDNGAGFTTLPGTGLSNGTFSVANVPLGNYYLQLNTTYRWTQSRVVNLTPVGAFLGRPDIVTAPANTSLNFNVSNLSPYQPNGQSTGDLISLYSVGAGEYYVDVGGFLNPQPSTNATTLTGMFNLVADGLIDATKGDVTYLSQLVRRSLPDGTPYNVITKFLQSTTFREMGGVTNSLSGTFSNVPQSMTFSAIWQRSQFWALKSAMTASSSPVCNDSFNISAQPSFSTYGQIGATADLLWVFPLSTSMSDISLQNVLYGDPYPTAWDRIGNAGLSCVVTYPVPGTSQGATIQASIGVQGTLSVIGSTLAPVLTPVATPTINGKDLRANNSGVGTTPTIGWQPPATGTPAAVNVTVYQLMASGNSGTAKLVGNVFVDSPSATSAVKIPPGIIVGGTYVILVSALSGSGAGPYGVGDVISGTITP